MVKILCWYLRALSSYVRCGCDFLVRGLSKNVDGRMNAGWIRGWQGGDVHDAFVHSFFNVM